MRRSHYLVLILLLIAQTSFGQIYQNMAQPGYKFSRARFDSVLTIPTGLGNLKNISGGQDTGQIRFNKSDSSVYVWNGRAWIKAGGGTIPTLQQVTTAGNVSQNSINVEGNNNKEIKLSSDINPGTFAKFRIASGTSTIEMGQQGAGSVALGFTGAGAARSIQIPDASGTIALLSDTTTLSNRINLKVNISDTASMLSAYARSAAVALKLNIADTIGNGNLFIRNTTTQENKRFNVKSGFLDSLYASTSGGGKVVSNGGTVAAEWGVGGGRNFDFHGFAGYNLNRASGYTARSFTDKNYVDSSLTLKTTVTSYGKNAGGDSTILLLSNGTRYAAKDSVGGGGASGWSLTGNASAVTDFLGTTNNRTMRFRTNNVERMVIDSIGNVGIGTSAPTSILDMVSNSSVTTKIKSNLNTGNATYSAISSTNNVIEVGMWGSIRGGFGVIEGNNGYIYTNGDFAATSANNIKFGTGGSNIERMRLTTAGRVLIGTTTENTSALLNVTSTTQGVLFPRMTTTQKNAIASPAAGLVVYDTTLNKLCVRTASAWETITSL